MHYTLVVEDSEEEEEVPQMSGMKAHRAALITLTLGMLGSSVFPLPFAFSRMGVLLGVLTSVAVALANLWTGTALLRAAGHVGLHSIEDVAQRLCGSGWRLVAETSQVLLLFGTLCGSFALIADLVPPALGAWPGLARGAGLSDWALSRWATAALGLGAVVPLATRRGLAGLEAAGAAGCSLVVALAGLMAALSWRAGFPALGPGGDVPTWSLRWTPDLPEACAVLSFAFYVHPMLLPLLADMPPGARGVRVVRRANAAVTLGVALGLYTAVGVAGAARFGRSTSQDLLLDPWLPPRRQGLVCAAALLYLALSAAPVALALRLQLEGLLRRRAEGSGRSQAQAAAASPRGSPASAGAPLLGDARCADACSAPAPRAGSALLALLSVGAALGVALTAPHLAEKIFAVTGATAVCAVCYVLPVVFHFRLYRRAASPASEAFSFGALGRRRLARASGGGSAALAHEAPSAPWFPARHHSKSSVESDDGDAGASPRAAAPSSPAALAADPAASVASLGAWVRPGSSKRRVRGEPELLQESREGAPATPLLDYPAARDLPDGWAVWARHVGAPLLVLALGVGSSALALALALKKALLA